MIPTYNPRPDYLKETLQSVLQQDPGRSLMQIEVIDDGSPDGAPFETIQSIAGDRVKVVSEKVNRGLAGIWNKCIEHARGHWVHILHQDDLVNKGFYKALRAGAEAYPEVGAAFCRHAYCDENGHWDRLSTLEMPAPGVLPHFVEPLVTGYHIQCASIAVKRSTYEKLGGFDPELEHALDWEMWIRIADVFPIYYEPQILAAWRVHREATTSTQRRTGGNIRDIAKAIGIWSGRLRNSDAKKLAAAAFQRFADEALDGAKHFLSQNDFAACRRQISEALACDSSFRFRKRALAIHISALLASLRPHKNSSVAGTP